MMSSKPLKCKKSMALFILLGAALLIGASLSYGTLNAAPVSGTSIKDIKTTPTVDCDEKVRALEAETLQLSGELNALKEEQKALISRKPEIPSQKEVSNSVKEKYYSDMQNWQKQMGDIADRIDKKSRELSDKQNRLSAAKAEAEECRSRRH